MTRRNAFYAQSGGVTAVINASAAGVIETARRHKGRIGKVYAGRNGIIGALTEDLIDTSRESARAIAPLMHTPAGACGSCRYKHKGLEENRAQYAFLNPFSYLGRANKAPYLRSIMGTMKVSESRCTRCGICQKYCASNAVSLNPYPQFSSACTGCWGCYNICPEAAISAFTGTRGRYTSRAEYLEAAAAGI